MSYANKNDWSFVFDGPSKDFPGGYYYHKPTGEKYSWEGGIQDKVTIEDEFYIYNGWWLDNG